MRLCYAARVRAIVRVSITVLALSACGFDAGGVGDGTQDGTGVAEASSDGSSPGTTDPTTSTSTTPGSDDTSSTSSASAPTSSSEGAPDDTSSSTAADESSTGAPEPCLDLLWVSNVVDPSGTTDAPLVDRLEQLGYDITFVRDDLAVSSDADGRCAVLLSAVSDSDDIGPEFYDTPVPVVVWEYALYDDMGFGMGHGQDGELEILVVAEDTELAAGLSGVQATYGDTGRTNWAMIDSGTIIATRNNGSGHATMFAYAAGETLQDGSGAAGARVALPFSNVPGATLEEPAFALFEAAVAWATAQ